MGMLRLVSTSSSDEDSEDMNEEEEVDDETDKKKKKKRKVKKEVKKQMGKQKDKKKEVKKELEKVMRPYQQGFSGGKGRPPPLFRPPIIECPTEPYDMGGCVFPIEELHKPEAIECGEELVVCEHPGEKDITEIKGGSSDKFGPHLQYMGGPPDKMGGPEKMLRLVSASSSDKDSEDMSMVQMRGRERESEEEE